MLGISTSKAHLQKHRLHIAIGQLPNTIDVLDLNVADVMRGQEVVAGIRAALDSLRFVLIRSTCRQPVAPLVMQPANVGCTELTQN